MKTPTSALLLLLVSPCQAFKYVGLRKTWLDARAYCFATFSTDLATLLTQADVDEALAAVSGTGRCVGLTWIGMNDRKTEGTWEWSDGSTPTLTNWKPNEPNNFGGNENCGAMVPSGRWNDQACTVENPFLCASLNVTTACSVGTCPPPSAPAPAWPEGGGGFSGSETQMSIFIIKSGNFGFVVVVVVAFLACLYCKGCTWNTISKKEWPQEVLDAPHQPCCCCCCGEGACELVDHTAARKAATSSTQEAQQPPRRVQTAPFDCIRGFGALQVAIGHYYAFWSTNVMGEAGFAGADFGGGNAVLMFFIMSGFVMQVGYANKGPADGTCPCCIPTRAGCCCEGGCCKGCNRCCLGCGGTFSRQFWARRFARMMPAVWLSLMLYLPIYYFEYMPLYNDLPIGLRIASVVEEAMVSMTNLQTWLFSAGFGGMNGVLWTVVAQTFFYLLFPCMVDKFHRDRITPASKESPTGPKWDGNLQPLFSIVTCNTLTYIGLWMASCGGNPMEGYMLAHASPANKIPLFVIGMELGSQALINSGPGHQNMMRRDATFWGAVATGITLFLAVFTLMQVLGSTLFSSVFFGFNTRIYGGLLLPPVYATWMYALTQSPEGLTARVFNIKPFRILGDLSFAIYVLHFPILHYYSWVRHDLLGGSIDSASSYWRTPLPCTPGPGTNSQDGLASWDIAPAFVVLLLASALVHYGFERPLRSRLSKWLSPPMTRRVEPHAKNAEV